MSSSWYKNKEDDLIWWKDNPSSIGEWIFSFDKEKEFNMFRDYPHKLTPKEKKTFDEENPRWGKFFSNRK